MAKNRKKLKCKTQRRKHSSQLQKKKLQTPLKEIQQIQPVISNIPPKLPQLIRHSCFANAALQAFASALIPAIQKLPLSNNNRSPFFYHFLNLFLYSSQPSYESLLASIQQNSRFSEVKFGMMDDAMAFVDCLIAAFRDEDKSFEKLFQYDKKKLCDKEECDKEELQDISSILFPLTTQIAHSFISMLMELLECPCCRKSNQDAEMELPHIIPIRLNKQLTDLRADLFIPLSKTIQYELVGVLISSGVHATCYRKINNQWSHCDDSTGSKLKQKLENGFFSLDNIYSLGLIYKLKDDCSTLISYSSLKRLAASNNIEYELPFSSNFNRTLDMHNFRKIEIPKENSISTMSRKMISKTPTEIHLAGFFKKIMGNGHNIPPNRKNGTNYDVIRSTVSEIMDCHLKIVCRNCPEEKVLFFFNIDSLGEVEKIIEDQMVKESKCYTCNETVQLYFPRIILIHTLDTANYSSPTTPFIPETLRFHVEGQIASYSGNFYHLHQSTSTTGFYFLFYKK